MLEPIFITFHMFFLRFWAPGGAGLGGEKLPLGASMLTTWVNLRTVGFLGAHGANMGQLGANLGPTWVLLGLTWSPLGVNLGPTWGNLGPTWANLGPIWPNSAPT